MVGGGVAVDFFLYHPSTHLHPVTQMSMDRLNQNKVYRHPPTTTIFSPPGDAQLA